MNDEPDLLRRGVHAADHLRNATHHLSSAWTAHRIALYRDLSLVSAIVVTGLVLFIGPDDVTWITAYYGAVVAFLLVLFISAAVMRSCVASERRRLVASEATLARLSSAIRGVEVNPSPEARSALAAALSDGVPPEPEPSRLLKFGESAALWLFILALLGAFAGLMLDPSSLRTARDPGPDILTTSYDATRI